MDTDAEEDGVGAGFSQVGTMTNVEPVSPTNPHIERVCGVEDGASEDEHENESDQKVADDEVEEKETEEALRIRV